MAKHLSNDGTVTSFNRAPKQLFILAPPPYFQDNTSVYFRYLVIPSEY